MLRSHRELFSSRRAIHSRPSSSSTSHWLLPSLIGRSPSAPSTTWVSKVGADRSTSSYRSSPAPLILSSSYTGYRVVKEVFSLLANKKRKKQSCSVINKQSKNGHVLWRNALFPKWTSVIQKVEKNQTPMKLTNTSPKRRFLSPRFDTLLQLSSPFLFFPENHPSTTTSARRLLEAVVLHALTCS